MIFVNYPGHLITVIFVVCCVGLMVGIFRSKDIRKAGWRRWVLGAVQLAVVLILFLILCDPCRGRSTERWMRNSVLVLFDTSESMSVVEEGKESRLEKAIDKFRERLSIKGDKGPNFRIYGFDERCYYAESLSGLRRWGRQTNMQSCVNLLLQHEAASESGGSSTAASGKVAGAIVFTDGQANEKNVEAYPSMGGSFDVVVFGVGIKDAKNDVCVGGIEAPAQASIDTAYRVEVEVSAVRKPEEAVKLELFRDGFVVASKQLSFEGSRRKLVTEFTVGAEVLGTHTLSARVKRVGEEVNTANNERSTLVRVIENSKLKVLFYSQVANFDVGKVRRALSMDKKVELYLGLDAIIDGREAAGSRLSGNKELPEDAAGFYEYDVVVLGPCAADSLSDKQIEGLYSFVVERGGGLIVMPGRGEYSAESWDNSKIATLLPTWFDKGGGVGDRRGYGTLEITAEGKHTGAIESKMVQIQDETVHAWYEDVKKKPAATVLAIAGDLPIAVVHRVGKGRVCLVNARRLFTWYREDLGGGLLREFFSGLTGYVGRIRKVESRVELFAERAGKEAETVRFDAFVCDRDFYPVADATVLLDTGSEILSMSQVSEGHYEAESQGIFEQSVVASVQAEKEGIFLGEKTIALNLPAVRSEMDNVELDTKFLRALTKRIGGDYLDVDEIDGDLPDRFASKSRVQSLTEMVSIWPRWDLLVGLCVLLSINWFARRVMGMV